jgi:DNA-directed RNA polymerase specialized sigma24 family protein
VLVLKYMEGLRVAEIAQRLSQTDEAIESLLARARESFRRAIGRRPDRSEVVQ